MKAWTIEEDTKLKAFVLEHRDTLGIAGALRKGGEMLGRSYSQARNRWYRVLAEGAVEQEELEQLLELQVATIAKMREVSKALRADKERLKKIIEKVEKERDELKEEYTALLNVINTARKIVVDEEIKGTKFRMDRNGNLERVIV